MSFYFAPTRLHTAESRVKGDGPLPLSLPRVDIVKTYAGADDAPIRALIQRAVAERAADSEHPGHGIVVEGFAYSGAPHAIPAAGVGGGGSQTTASPLS